MARPGLLAAQLLLLSSLAVACGAFTSSPPADPSPPSSAGSSFDLTGTLWKSGAPAGKTTSDDECNATLRNLKFEADGTFSYETKCDYEESWRSFDEANDLWNVEGGQVSLMYNGGYRRCTGSNDKRELILECRNENGTSKDILERVR
jgi:hypothetical protein